jgi:hypothetical protein
MNEIQSQRDSFFVLFCDDSTSIYTFSFSQLQQLKQIISRFISERVVYDRRITDFTFQESKAIMRGIKTMYDIPLDLIDNDDYMFDIDPPLFYDIHQRPSEFESPKKRPCI